MLPEEKMLHDMVTDAVITAQRKIKPSDFKIGDVRVSRVIAIRDKKNCSLKEARAQAIRERQKSAVAAFRSAIRERSNAVVWLGSQAANLWLSWIDIDQRRLLHQIDWPAMAKRHLRIMQRWQRADERRLKSCSDNRRPEIEEKIEQRTKQLRVLRHGIKALES